MQPPPPSSISHLSHLASMQPTNPGGFSHAGQQNLPAQGCSTTQPGSGQSGAQAQGAGGMPGHGGQEYPGGPGHWGAPQPNPTGAQMGGNSPTQQVAFGGKGSPGGGHQQTAFGKGSAPQWGQTQPWGGLAPAPQPSAGTQMGWGQTPPGMWNPAQAAQQGMAGGGHQWLPPAGRGRPTSTMGPPSMGVSPGGWPVGPMGYMCRARQRARPSTAGFLPWAGTREQQREPSRGRPPPPAGQDMEADLDAIAGVYGESVEQQQAMWTVLQQQKADLDLAIQIASRQERDVVARKLVEAEQEVQQRKQALQGMRNRVAAATAEQVTPMPPSPQPATPGEGCYQGSPFFYPGHPLGLAYVPKASSAGPPPKAQQPGVSPVQNQGTGGTQQEATPVQEQNQGCPDAGGFSRAGADPGSPTADGGPVRARTAGPGGAGGRHGTPAP